MTDQMSQQVKQLSALDETTPNSGSFISSIFVLLILLAGVGVFGYAARDWWSMYKSSTSSVSPTLTSTPTPTVVVAQSKTSPTPAKQNLQIKIQVQNGTGIAGEANKVKDLLTAAGYTDVSTANASAYDYLATVIMTKESSSVDVSSIKDIVEKTYPIDSKKNQLDVQSEYDLVIIVGKK